MQYVLELVWEFCQYYRYVVISMIILFQKEGLFSIYLYKYIYVFIDRFFLYMYIDFFNILVYILFKVLNCIYYIIRYGIYINCEWKKL